MATWTLPVSKTDPAAHGMDRTWRCLCSASSGLCPYHALSGQVDVLRRRLVHYSPDSPLFADVSGNAPTKVKIVAAVECVASLLHLPVVTESGRRYFGGHSLRVTGAQHLARC
eukprot:3508435-Amphidinium_carterae.1